MTYTHYTVTDSRTGESWTEAFTAQDARFIRVPHSADGLSAEQASAFVRSMNIAQSNHLSEFKYSLPTPN